MSEVPSGSMRNALSALLVLAPLVAGCEDGTLGGAAGNPPATMDAQRGALTASDFDRPWAVLSVPLEPQESVMALDRDSRGFVALLRRTVNNGKAILAQTHRVAFSADGLRWSSHPLDDRISTWFRDVTWANGLYIAVGGQGGTDAIMRTSSDGQNWTEISVPTLGLTNVSYVNGRFFAGGILGALLVSSDGQSWTVRSQREGQFNGVAHGNGVYVLSGNVGFYFSTDTVTWTSVPATCTDRNSCVGVTPPDWMPGQPVSIGANDIFFALGKFWVGKFVSSDGRTWSVISDPEKVPQAFVAGVLLRFSSEGLVRGSVDGEQWPLQTTVSAAAPGGMDCQSPGAFCFVQDKRIVLVPR